MNAKPIELVVARYSEDVAWLHQAAEYVDCIWLYDKSPGFGCKNLEIPKTQIQWLPNVGREAHTYAYHLSLLNSAVVTVFCQGNPFDHCRDFLDQLHDLSDGRMKVSQRVLLPGGVEVDVEGFREMTDVHAWDSVDGGICFQNWKGNPGRQPIDLQALWDALHVDEAETLSSVHFGCGAQFVVTDHAVDAVRNARGQDFFGRAVSLLRKQDWRTPHEFERLWAQIFCGCLHVPEDVEYAE